MEKLNKGILGLAGEYAVASELCKRGIYAQLTLGHHKRTDILVETEYCMTRIQVKAKQGKEWPGVRGIYREDDFLVLVDLESKEYDKRPDFYILNLEDWKELIDKEKQRYDEAEIDDKLCIRYPDGWKGLDIKLNQANSCKEAWNKITDQVKSL